MISGQPKTKPAGPRTTGGQNCPFTLDRCGNVSDASGDGCGMIGGLSFNANNQIVGYVYGASDDLLSDTSGPPAVSIGRVLIDMAEAQTAAWQNTTPKAVASAAMARAHGAGSA
ncbi:MAG: hypothetical protein ACRD17_00960 [Terriglobales bacterium]